jgi:hypothetical protein
MGSFVFVGTSQMVMTHPDKHRFEQENIVD